MTHYILIFLLLLVGFGILFQRIRWLKLAAEVLQRTRSGVEQAARERLLNKRRQLMNLQQDNTLMLKLEQELGYCGWKRHFPFLTAELWLLGNVVMLALMFLTVLALSKSFWFAGGTVAGAVGCEYLLMKLGKAGEMRAVNENLLEFLNFLGNYSITAGEVTGVFGQVSKYVEEPIKSALEQCSYEAQTTGDAGLALLAMAEKIEHPKFKEVVHNMEVSIRYCADFKILVDTSRRSVREYLRMGEDRKSMLREAVINMLMLVAMSVFALFTVNGLVEQSIWDVLFFTIPGKVALGIVAVILVLLLRKLLGMNQ